MGADLCTVGPHGLPKVGLFDLRFLPSDAGRNSRAEKRIQKEMLGTFSRCKVQRAARDFCMPITVGGSMKRLEVPCFVRIAADETRCPDAINH